MFAVVQAVTRIDAGTPADLLVTPPGFFSDSSIGVPIPARPKPENPVDLLLRI
jgi:hypothetical protein